MDLNTVSAHALSRHSSSTQPDQPRTASPSPVPRRLITTTPTSGNSTSDEDAKLHTSDPFPPINHHEFVTPEVRVSTNPDLPLQVKSPESDQHVSAPASSTSRAHSHGYARSASLLVRTGRRRSQRTRSRSPAVSESVPQPDSDGDFSAAHTGAPATSQSDTSTLPQCARQTPSIPGSQAAQMPGVNSFSVDQPRRRLRRHSSQTAYRDRRARANLRCNTLPPIVEAISEPTLTEGLPRSHMLVVHNSLDPVRDPNRRATCKHCALSFPSRNALFAHLKLCVLPKVLQRIDTLEELRPRVLHCQGVTIAAAALLLADADSMQIDANDMPLPSADYQQAADGSYDKLTLEEAGPLIIGGAPFGMQVTVSNEQRSRSKSLVAYYDSGGPSSVISPELLKELNVSPDNSNGGRRQRLVFTGFTSGERFATQTAVIRLKVGQEKVRNVRFWVCSGSPVPLLVGADNMTGPGAECFIDCNLRRPTLSFKDSRHTYRAVRSLQPEAITFLADTVIPPLSEMIVQIQTRAYNTQLLLSQAWMSSTLFTSGRQVVVRTDSVHAAVCELVKCSVHVDSTLWVLHLHLGTRL